MSAEEKVTVTMLGVVCSACGHVIDDQELLAEASCVRWRCPFCGARHLSLNDERAGARVIECCCEEEPQSIEEETGTEIGRMDPGELQRRHDEFMRRGTL